MLSTFCRILCLVVLVSTALADGVDWIDPRYLVAYSSRENQDVAKAARAICQRARRSARNGPFTITKGSIKAPSGKASDYLSWAPYHWPNCNWCKPHGTTDTQDFNGEGEQIDDGSSETSHAGEASPEVDETRLLLYSIETAMAISSPPLWKAETTGSLPMTDTLVPSTSVAWPVGLGTSEGVEADHRPNPTAKSTCTPSPTTSMPPSATWTKCPYKARDGVVNTDRNQLHGLSQLLAFSQSLVDNAIAFIVNGDTHAAQDAVNFIDAFLLSSKTGMSPSISWGQTIRGPATRGSYMGVLDFRVMVKVVNAVQILKTAKSPYWTGERETRMNKWAKDYMDWLETNEVGSRPRTSANNHSSFYHAQLAALRILVGDEGGARKVVQAYFAGPFREQIVASGEQPFESTRTKPLHYRAFNAEAMLVAAKLGDYLGLDTWTAQTKYRATIKSAIDYLIGVDPGQEDPGIILPLVAAAWAAYGDDQRATYRRTLETGRAPDRSGSSAKQYPYKSKTWWFYQQPNALRHTPRAAHRRHLTRREAHSDPTEFDERGHLREPDQRYLDDRQLVLASSMPSTTSATSDTISIDTSFTSVLPEPQSDEVDGGFISETVGTITSWDRSGSKQSDECDHQGGICEYSSWVVPSLLPVLHPGRPEPFSTTDAVELDEGIFVYWWQIKHLYDDSAEQKRPIWARW